MIRRASCGAGARRGTAFTAALVLAASLPIGSGDLQVAMFGDPPNRWRPEGRRYVAGSAAQLPAAGAIRLEPAGVARRLPPGICGASSEPLIERLIGNQAKVAALKEIAPAILRFPGGSQSNFYDWKTGLLDFHENPQSSQYIKFWARIAPKIAANGGARHQRVIERGTSPVSPGVSFGDSYREVEGAVFVSAGQTTLILENAGAAARAFDPTDAGRLPAPKSVQIIATSDLNDSERRAAQVTAVSAPGPFTLPPYSVVRVIWPAEVKVTK